MISNMITESRKRVKAHLRARSLLFKLKIVFIGSSAVRILTRAGLERVITRASIHLMIVSVNKSEDGCVVDVPFEQVV